MVESGGGEEEGWDEDGVRNVVFCYEEDLKVMSTTYFCKSVSVP